MSARIGSTPITVAARERLRDQQQREARLLAAVLAAQRRLAAERDRADAVIRTAQRAIDTRQVALDHCVCELIASSGIARAAILLDQRESDLARLTRKSRRQAQAGNSAEAGGPGVPA